jgi:hypothetical protein
MGLLSEYHLTDELTQDALKELGFGESYAMTLSDNKAYDNVFKAKFYHANTFSFNHKSFYCSYRYFPKLNYLSISIEAMPGDYLSHYSIINTHDVNKRFDCIVKHYSDLLVYLTDEWVIEQVKNFKFLIY